MDSQLKEQIEKGVQIAFQRYKERHPSFAHHLEKNHSQIISSTIKSIENDPGVIAVMKRAQAETGLLKIIEAAQNTYPR
jgi:hypothetical protein